MSATTRILVTTNNFWVGGRETYVATYLRALCGRVAADLVCGSLQEGLPEATVFGAVGVAKQRSLASWLAAGEQMVTESHPALIWAQHFDLLPAWLLARRHDLPLLATFHGPLLDVNRPNDLTQALGMTLTIRGGDMLSAVSPEACFDLERLAGRSVALLPNVVTGAARGLSAPEWPPRRWLLVTRQGKLGHLRAAVRLFAAFHQHILGSRLLVASGDSPAQGAAPGLVASVRRGLEVLGYRWCKGEGSSLWRALPAVRWLGYAADPRALAQRADLVLGMGRVLLEGLAEGRPALLVGYEHVHGLLGAGEWDALAYSNFSGRGVEALSLASCVRCLSAATPPRFPDVARIAAAQPAGRLLEIVETARAQLDDATRLSAARAWEIAQAGGDDAAVFASLADGLDRPGQECLFRLSRG